MSFSYSRSSIISLMKETLLQLRDMSGQFPSYELCDPFTIRMKMMESLARLAFNYSLKVSYLNENTEYAYMAEVLDDVLLQLRRCGLEYKASSYGVIVTREYELLQDALDLLDERLKTVRVVCFNRRDRRVRKPVYKRYHVRGSSCWVDENGFRMRTPYPTSVPEDEDTYTNNIGRRCFMQEEDGEIMPMQDNQISTNTAPKQEPETRESAFKRAINRLKKDQESTKYNKESFTQFKNQFMQYINEFETVAQLHYLNDNEKLFRHCKIAEKLFNYISENADYISNNFDINFNTGCISNLPQIILEKCVQITEEINNKYDKLRSKNRRSDPTLRAAKSAALGAIKHAQEMLS